jgi:hypothetical protein
MFIHATFLAISQLHRRYPPDTVLNTTTCNIFIHSFIHLSYIRAYLVDMRLSFLSLAFAALATALDLDVCSLPVYDAIELFADYQPAQEYCSKSYPIPWATETHWHHYTKTHLTTLTLPTTVTETTTTTISIVSKKNRRAAANSAKAWQSVVKVLKQDGKIEPGCSCIETTPTTTTISTTTTTSTIITTTVYVYCDQRGESSHTAAVYTLVFLRPQFIMLGMC